MDEIQTPRLVLRLMTVPFLEASIDGNFEDAASEIDLAIPADWHDDSRRRSWRHFLTAVKAHPRADWGPRAVGLSSAGKMVGHIGFHTAPNPEYLQPYVGEGIEMGYTVFEAHRRQGIATEAIRGLAAWAARSYGVKAFVVSVSPANVPSTNLALKLGFTKIGEHQDEVDGLEYVYRADALTLSS